MIPSVIHCVWLSGEDKPQLIKNCIESWKKVMPDFEIKEWSMNDIINIKSNFLHDAIKAKKWAFATDFLRVYLLYHYGAYIWTWMYMYIIHLLLF